MLEESTNSVKRRKKKEKEVGALITDPLSAEEVKEREEDAKRDALEERVPELPIESVVVSGDEGAELYDEYMVKSRAEILFNLENFLKTHETAARRVGRRGIANDIKAVAQVVEQFKKRTEGVLYWREA